MDSATYAGILGVADWQERVDSDVTWIVVVDDSRVGGASDEGYALL